VTTGNIPRRYWPSYVDGPLPTPQEALGEQFRAFPSWFLRIECDRCGRVQVISEVHATNGQRNMPLLDLLSLSRHRGCGGRAARVELVTGVERVSCRPVRRIVLRE
jgi:hypothetical protein